MTKAEKEKIIKSLTLDDLARTMDALKQIPPKLGAIYVELTPGGVGFFNEIIKEKYVRKCTRKKAKRTHKKTI